MGWRTRRIINLVQMQKIVEDIKSMNEEKKLFPDDDGKFISSMIKYLFVIQKEIMRLSNRF